MGLGSSEPWGACAALTECFRSLLAAPLATPHEGIPFFQPSTFLPGSGSPLTGLLFELSLVAGEGPSPLASLSNLPSLRPSAAATRSFALRRLLVLSRSGRPRSGLLLRSGRSLRPSSAESSGLTLPTGLSRRELGRELSRRSGGDRRRSAVRSAVCSCA